MPMTLIADEPSDAAIEEAEAAVRAQIVTDYVTAIRRGDVVSAAQAECLAIQLDALSPDGPRLADELAGLNLPAAA